MPIAWKETENTEKLLSAIFVWHEESGVKIDYRRIATIFGSGATYDAVKCNMRRFKAKSDELKSNLASGSNEEPAPTPRSRKKKDENEVAGGVLSGRVSKNSSPKKNRASKIKDEPKEEDESGDGV